MLRKIDFLLEHLLPTLGYNAHLYDHERLYGRRPERCKFIEQGDTPYDWVVTLGKYQMMIVSKMNEAAAEYRKAEHERYWREFEAQMDRDWEAEQQQPQQQ